MALSELFGEARRRLEAASPLVKGLAVFATLFVAAKATGQVGRARLNRNAVRHLECYKFEAERKFKVTEWLLDELQAAGVFTLDEIAVLLTIASWETRFTPQAVSADGMPDDAVGKSWGVLQFSGDTIRGLGGRLEDLIPRRGADGKVSLAELERATRGSARFAGVACTHKGASPKWAGGKTWLAAVRELHRDDELGLAREFCVRWQAGPGRRWDDIMRHRPSRTMGTLGFVHHTTHDRIATLPYFRAAVGLSPLEAELLGWVRAARLAS